jgi:hypothetical protein
MIVVDGIEINLDNREDLDLEAIEIQIDETLYVQQTLGFLHLDHFREERAVTAAGLLQFGDCFLQRLGMALSKASTRDAIKIMRYWHKECEQCSILLKMVRAKLQTTGEKPHEPSAKHSIRLK